MEQQGQPETQNPPQNAPEKLKISYFDKAFAGIKDKDKKSPVSILQELLATTKTLPTYEIFEVDHSGLRKCRGSFQDLSAVADGESKRSAKQAAAKALLHQLVTISTVALEESQNAPVKKFIAEKIEASEDPAFVLPPAKRIRLSEIVTTENYVGHVLEYCRVLKLTHPTYEIESETGPAHDKSFTIRCTVEDMQTTGEGRNKKTAKQQAAHNMMKILHEKLESERVPAVNNTVTIEHV